MAEEQKEKFKAKYFRKPVSLFFALFGTLPFFLFLINVCSGGKNSLMADSFKMIKEQNITDEWGTAAEVIKADPKHFAAILLMLAVFLFMGVTGTIDWMKKRFYADVGPKFVPNLYAFINTLGVWLAHWMVVSSFMIVFIIRVFDFYELLPALGLGKMGAYVTWGMAFLGMAQALFVFIVMKILMFLLDKRWDIRRIFWQGIVLRFAAWVKKISSEQGARAAVCFMACALFILGLCLIYKGAKPGSMQFLKKASSAVSMEKITGGTVPEALTGVSAQMNPREINGNAGDDYSDWDFEEGVELFYNDAESANTWETVNDFQATNASENKQAAGTGAYLIYSGLFSILLGLVAMGFLAVKNSRSQQY